ncbi:acyltransferase [Sphingobacterium sp. B29]|uniref:acyltransferase family protein n=1 Tax=Sphingobacterium sp. B29 TaxID=1933220 RepID=UPI000957F302|nr:acyltransferase [Sphingobacterium sp. B29]APU98347.1 acyltransferase [Sphingobacterium sp. B29]
MIHQTKKHFELLDAMRGVAAIAVVLFHFMEIAQPDYRNSFIPHSYLAVDFFFCLSGFVIAYAYDQKLVTIGLKRFFLLRLLRLHPLVIIGTLIGLFAFIYDPFSNLASSFSVLQKIGMFISGITLIPYPAVPERYFNLFHLNPPTWSLFWEYIANIAYALILVRIPKKVLWGIVLLGAAALCAESFRSGYLAVGFGADNFWAGGIRLWFSFSMGLLIFRSNWTISNKLPFFSVLGLLAVVFFIPFSDVYGKYIDPIVVIFYFPLLLMLGIGGLPVFGGVRKLCKFLGDISYPLYIIHYPFIWIFMSYVELHHPSNKQMAVIIIIGMLSLIFLALLVFKYLDEPIRKYYSRKLN